MNKRTRILLAVLSVTVAFAASMYAVAAQTGPHPDFVRSWTEAVQRGLIAGDPAYYYSGAASQEEINHALLVALLSIDDETYQQPPDAPAEAYCSGTDTVAIDTYPTNGYHYVYSVNLPAHYTRVIGLTDGQVQFIEEWPAPGTYGPAERIIVCYNDGEPAATTTSSLPPTPTTTSTTTTQATTTTTSTLPTTSSTTTTSITVPPSSTTTSQPTTTTTLQTSSPLRLTGKDSGSVLTGLTISNPDGDCITIEGADNIRIENSTIGPCGRWPVVNAKAIYALDSTNISVVGNHFVGESRNAVQYDKVNGGDITRNTVNYPQGASYAEDLINLFASHNIVVDGNQLSGGGPSDSGSCIMLGDGEGSRQTAINNVCTDPGQVGIGVAGGTFITVSDNTIRSSSYPWSNVGGYIWNQYGGACHDIVWERNVIEWYNSAGVRNDFWNGGGC